MQSLRGDGFEHFRPQVCRPQDLQASFTMYASEQPQTAIRRNTYMVVSSNVIGVTACREEFSAHNSHGKSRTGECSEHIAFPDTLRMG
jgi:hypothetical protein